jgi:hypothetical protein
MREDLAIPRDGRHSTVTPDSRSGVLSQAHDKRRT